MIKLIRESLLNEDEPILNEEDLKETNELATKFAEHVAKSFSDFKGEFDSKPGGIGQYIDKNGFFIYPIVYRLYICDLIFEFRVEFTSSFNRGKIKVIASFVHRGNTAEKIEFTTEYAEELLRATKIAESLKEEAKTEFSKFNN